MKTSKGSGESELKHQNYLKHRQRRRRPQASADFATGNGYPSGRRESTERKVPNRANLIAKTASVSTGFAVDHRLPQSNDAKYAFAIKAIEMKTFQLPLTRSKKAVIKPVVIPAESRHAVVPMMTAEGLQSAASSLKLEVRMSEKSNQFGEYKTEDPATYNLR